MYETDIILMNAIQYNTIFQYGQQTTPKSKIQIQILDSISISILRLKKSKSPKKIELLAACCECDLQDYLNLEFKCGK